MTFRSLKATILDNITMPDQPHPDAYSDLLPYVYVFVRQDLPSLEQVCVQAAHAALELGRRMTSDQEGPPPSLVLIGVRDGRRMRKLVREELPLCKSPSVVFREPDLRNQVTAAAVGPLRGPDRAVFKRWKTLLLTNRPT